MSLAIALLCLALATAPIDPDIASGEAAYREQRWDDASAAFDAAYRRTGDPTFLYTRAQAERRAGRCEIAIDLYERFVASDPPAQAKSAAEQYIDECRRTLPDPEPAPDSVQVRDDASTDDDAIAASPSPREVAPPRRWFRDPWGGTLVGTGAAAIVTGGALLGVAYRDAARAPDSGDDRTYGDRIERARRLQIAGATVLSVGAALTIAGIVRWAVLARRGRRSSAWGLGPGSLVIVGNLPAITTRSAGSKRRALDPAPFHSPPRSRRSDR